MLGLWVSISRVLCLSISRDLCRRAKDQRDGFRPEPAREATEKPPSPSGTSSSQVLIRLLTFADLTVAWPVSKHLTLGADVVLLANVCKGRWLSGQPNMQELGVSMLQHTSNNEYHTAYVDKLSAAAIKTSDQEQQPTFPPMLMRFNWTCLLHHPVGLLTSYTPIHSRFYTGGYPAAGGMTAGATYLLLFQFGCAC